MSRSLGNWLIALLSSGASSLKQLSSQWNWLGHSRYNGHPVNRHEYDTKMWMNYTVMPRKICYT